MSDHANMIAGCIDAAASGFQPNELAYYALTSKIERPILDRLSFERYRGLTPKGMIVAREHDIGNRSRADIAVLQDRRVMLAIEGKAMVSADCIREHGMRHEYSDAMQRDLHRYTGVAAGAAEVYCLLIAVHPLRSPPGDRAIKYHRLLRSAFTMHGTADAIRHSVDVNLGRLFVRTCQLVRGRFRPGRL